MGEETKPKLQVPEKSVPNGTSHKGARRNANRQKPAKFTGKHKDL